MLNPLKWFQSLLHNDVKLCKNCRHYRIIPNSELREWELWQMPELSSLMNLIEQCINYVSRSIESTISKITYNLM